MITKVSEGAVTQKFDAKGHLISQSFKADGYCEYFDHNDELLDEDRPENRFYHPFDMLLPK